MKNARVDQNVYNGTRKLVVADSDFMSPLEIIECVNLFCDVVPRGSEDISFGKDKSYN